MLCQIFRKVNDFFAGKQSREGFFVFNNKYVFEERRQRKQTIDVKTYFLKIYEYTKNIGATFKSPWFVYALVYAI